MKLLFRSSCCTVLLRLSKDLKKRFKNCGAVAFDYFPLFFFREIPKLLKEVSSKRKATEGKVSCLN